MDRISITSPLSAKKLRKSVRFPILMLALHLAPAIAEDTYLSPDYERLLSAVHEAATSGSLTMGMLPTLPGWNLKDTWVLSGNRGAGARFTLSVNQESLRGEFTTGGLKGSPQLKIELVPSAQCLSREKLVARWGSEFRPTMGNVDPYPSPDKLTAEVRLNNSIFGLGPAFHFKGPTHSSFVTFYFDFSKCAQHLILQINPA
jgi:hypothetical protein